MSIAMDHEAENPTDSVNARWLARLTSRLASPATRYLVYTLLAAALCVGAVALVRGKGTFNFVVSDGRFYYVYLPSLVIDGDLDFSNQMREHWDVDWNPSLIQNRTERGLVKNKYPIGVALTLAPAFLAGHTAALACHAATGAAWCAPDGYSTPYQICNLLFLAGLGAAALALADRLLTSGFNTPPAPTFLAVVTFWLGTPLIYYYLREPFMAHLAGLFWVTAAVVLVARLLLDLTQARLSGWRLFLLTFVTAMALVCRPTNAFLLPFGLYLLYRVARAGMVGRLLRLTPVVLLGLAPVYAQMAAWYYIYGHWVAFSYEGEGFRWLEPAAWQTLFSSRHGLFFWSPLLLASLGGVGWRLWLRRGRPEPLVWCFLAAFLLLWYANSCWWCWWFGDAFGARAFLELGSFFILGLASMYEAVGRQGRWTRLAFGAFMASCLVFHFVLLGLYISHRIPRGDSLL